MDKVTWILVTANNFTLAIYLSLTLFKSFEAIDLCSTKTLPCLVKILQVEIGCQIIY